jgi:hypothetical protein
VQLPVKETPRCNDPQEWAGAGQARGHGRGGGHSKATAAGYSTGADRTESNVEAGMQWADQVTYVEEEPWSEAFHATWPGYFAKCLGP